MLVADDRKDEYLAAGYKLAADNSINTEKAETVTEEPAKKAPTKKSTSTKKK